MSEKSYTISLVAPEDEESFEKNDLNIAYIKIRDDQNRWVEGGDVFLHLTTDAMIALGTSLIREALNPSSPFFEDVQHNDAAENGEVCMGFGIALHHESANLTILRIGDLPTIADMLEESKKKSSAKWRHSSGRLAATLYSVNSYIDQYRAFRTMHPPSVPIEAHGRG